VQFSEILTPTDQEVIFLPSGKDVKIPKARPVFERWAGEPLFDTYGNKAVLSFNYEPAFAELVILRILMDIGWEGVWVDSFRGKYRTSCFPLNEVLLPAEQQDILESIYLWAGSRSGCWDVFCWKDGSYLFAESKRHKHDRIRDTQRKWLEAAIEHGLPIESFLVVEWSTGQDKSKLLL
jgi:hypothetical protein